ncbi:MAG: cyclic nucleotide-binding domain-containing protein [Verrucomicrobia bacterium]|nr:cyclic nucleotide-binding domain-containing protein [Verrucomicrobiota bacterium]
MNPEELKCIAVLRDMDREALGRLAAVLEERRYADGQTVFAEEEPGDSMYFIKEGGVRIEKRAQTAATAQKVLTVLEAGDYFGEMALLDQKPRSASAVASGGARVLRLSKAAFDQLQAGGSAVGMNVLFAMIRTSSDRIRRLSTQLVVYDEVGKAIGEARELLTLLNVILQQLAAATTADWGLLLLRSQFSDQLEVRAQWNLTLSATQLEAVANAQGFLGPVQQNPNDLLVANFDDHDKFKACARLGFETASLLVSPITIEDQFLGLIVLGDHERDHFDLNSLHLVRGVARQTAQAILNARHREEEQARSRHSRQYVRF